MAATQPLSAGLPSTAWTPWKPSLLQFRHLGNTQDNLSVMSRQIQTWLNWSNWSMKLDCWIALSDSIQWIQLNWSNHDFRCWLQATEGWWNWDPGGQCMILWTSSTSVGKPNEHLEAYPRWLPTPVQGRKQLVHLFSPNCLQHAGCKRLNRNNCGRPCGPRPQQGHNFNLHSFVHSVRVQGHMIRLNCLPPTDAITVTSIINHQNQFGNLAG